MDVLIQIRKIAQASNLFNLVCLGQMISDSNLIQLALTYLYAESHNDHNKSACEFLTPNSWPIRNEKNNYELHKLAADLQEAACVLLFLKD